MLQGAPDNITGEIIARATPVAERPLLPLPWPVDPLIDPGLCGPVQKRLRTSKTSYIVGYALRAANRDVIFGGSLRAIPLELRFDREERKRRCENNAPEVHQRPVVHATRQSQ